MTKIALGLPWYNGPDKDCYPLFFEIIEYFGRLKERSVLRNRLGAEQFDGITLPPLWKEDPLADPTPAEWDALGEIQFGWADQGGLSLPGLARELCIESAQSWDADYIFFWDDDMKFPHSTFLQLWRHQKPVVGALAFTARRPFVPVIYRILETVDPLSGGIPKYESETILDYPKDRLITNKDVGGAIAFGSGVMLIDMKVFRQIPKPWFHSTGCGEDWYFCVRCHLNGIPRYVDTSLKTHHKGRQSVWVDEAIYDAERKAIPEVYEKAYLAEISK